MIARALFLRVVEWRYAGLHEARREWTLDDLAGVLDRIDERARNGEAAP